MNRGRISYQCRQKEAWIKVEQLAAELQQKINTFFVVQI